MAASKGGIIESKVISCCICLNSQPILNQIDQTVENEVITPFFKLLICVPEVDWLRTDHICRLCKDNLYRAYDFREMCFKSDFIRADVKIEVIKLEQAIDDKIDVTASAPEGLQRICNICFHFTRNLTEIGNNQGNRKNDKDGDDTAELTSISKLNLFVSNINWPENFAICKVCKDSLNRAYNFRELCFKSKFICEEIVVKLDENYCNNDDDKSKPPLPINLLAVINKCKHCGEIYDSKQQLIAHLRSKHPSKIVCYIKSISRSTIMKCKYCKREYKDQSSLQKHLDQMHYQKINLDLFPWNYSFEERLRLKHYLRTFRFKCEHCEKRFDCKQLLDTHLTEVHDVLTKQEIRKRGCTRCPKLFPTRSLRKRHIRTAHLDGLICEYCSKRYKTKKSLYIHLAEIHGVVTNNDKLLKLKCDHCALICFSRKRLNRHLIKHSNVFAYKCDYCDKAYKSNQGLQRHLAHIHNIEHNSFKQIKCHICSRISVTPFLFKRHLQSHSNARDFTCEHCNYRSKSKQSLQVHLIKVHDIVDDNDELRDKLRKYKCNQCTAAYHTASRLNYHLLSHSNIRSFQCAHCDKSYKFLHSLQKHLSNCKNLKEN